MAPRGSQIFDPEGVIYWAIIHQHTITHAGKRRCDLISLEECDMEGLLSNEGGADGWRSRGSIDSSQYIIFYINIVQTVANRDPALVLVFFP